MFDVFIMDMGGHDANVKYLQQQLPHAKILRWTDHLGTIRRAGVLTTTRYFWVISSCINYDNFDFLWEPTPWQAHQIHCWPSGAQKFGDTFLIPTDQWSQQQANLKFLEDYRDVNFEHDSLPRLPWQEVEYDKNKTLPQALESVVLTTPYGLYKNQPFSSQYDDAWLWRELPIISMSTDNGVSLVPRSAMTAVHNQVYDYKWLIKSKQPIDSQRLDIVFISNGETNAHDHWIQLINCTWKWSNRVVHVSGVNGRVAAYHAAAQASTTPWFFAVFAKLEVDARFDWSWQPDYWQQPKHYIFHAANPVNGLVYGHQAMIAYNRDLVLANSGHGLDFTLDSAHEVVPIVSGVARYADTPWMAWRTAFREVLKLCSNTDVESEYRRKQWLANGWGLNGDWSVLGAQDAVEYYESVAGDFAELRKSYDWAWLASYALIRRNLTPDP